MAEEQGKKYRPWAPDAFARHTYTASDRLPEDDLVFSSSMSSPYSTSAVSTLPTRWRRAAHLPTTPA